MYDLEDMSDTNYDTNMESVSHKIWSLYDHGRSRLSIRDRSNHKNNITIIANFKDHKMQLYSDEIYNMRYKSCDCSALSYFNSIIEEHNKRYTNTK